MGLAQPPRPPELSAQREAEGATLWFLDYWAVTVFLFSQKVSWETMLEKKHSFSWFGVLLPWTDVYLSWPNLSQNSCVLLKAIPQPQHGPHTTQLLQWMNPFFKPLHVTHEEQMYYETNRNKYKIDYLYYKAFFQSSELTLFFTQSSTISLLFFYFFLNHTPISKNLVTTTGPSQPLPLTTHPNTKTTSASCIASPALQTDRARMPHEHLWLPAAPTPKRARHLLVSLPASKKQGPILLNELLH